MFFYIFDTFWLNYASLFTTSSLSVSRRCDKSRNFLATYFSRLDFFALERLPTDFEDFIETWVALWALLASLTTLLCFYRLPLLVEPLLFRDMILWRRWGLASLSCWEADLTPILLFDCFLLEDLYCCGRVCCLFPDGLLLLDSRYGCTFWV